jgi:hypothetical protein
MKSLPALLAAVLLCVGTTACGGAGKGARSTSKAASTVASGGAPAATVQVAGSSARYLNDGDAEKKSDHDLDNQPGNHEDGDRDSVEEYEDTYDNGAYHDSDDGSVLTYGRAASPAETRAIAAIVMRYYAAAAVEDGAKACATMTKIDAATMVEDYGQGSAGPAYLSTGKSCQAVMSLIFKHAHSKLTGAVHVTGARVNGGEAYALLGSTTMPAGFIIVRREAGRWKIGTIIGGPLP